jgi:hypothetical protein
MFLLACGLSLLAIANWPLMVLVNRIYPFVLGMPFFVFVMFALNMSVALLLLLAYLATNRTGEPARSTAAVQERH